MKEPPLLLALDTSTSTASVALFDGQRVVSETTWLAGREHSTRLLVEIESALERIGRSVQELTGLVVARGPGSYTGVRVALSVGKGMAAGLAIPMWGVNSLDVVAHAAGHLDVPVRALLEAGRGRCATALYRRSHMVEAARLATLSDLVRLLTHDTLVIGDIDEEARSVLERETGAHLADPAACLRRAGFLAELGWRSAQAGEPGDPGSVDAVYIN